ncbi:DNA (cytosine-5)-methyltransferase PliMCI [Apiospora hydei]|uniref:DNA (cytosine-5-)-methyltransferase n=1 Tax=Apiospora hydei TaxID=1337664 RepID=A0ABR1WYT7_9PEZI
MPDQLDVLRPNDGAILNDDQWAAEVSKGMRLGFDELREIAPGEGTISDQDHDYSTWFNSTGISDLGFAPISPAPWPKSINDDDSDDVELQSCSDAATVQSEPYLGPTSSNLVVELPISTLSNPRSQYQGFVPPAPQKREWQAVEALLNVLAETGREPEPEYIEFELSDFSVYVNSSHYPLELRPLQHLCTRAASDTFYLDGVLSATNPISGTTMRFYVQRAPFRELPIEAYDDEAVTVESIWIRSDYNRKKEIYYKLGTPSREYERFHAPFLWVADLAHHVITYCAYLHSKGRKATLEDFQSRFKIFLCRKHNESVVFQSWAAAHGSDDFRTAVVANVDFLWKEAVGAGDERPGSPFHHFWKEIYGGFYKPNLSSAAQIRGDDDGDEDDQVDNSKNRTKPRVQDGKVAKTIVTPYMYEAFKDMPFGDVLAPISLATTVQACQTAMVQGTSQYWEDGKIDTLKGSIPVGNFDDEGLALSIRPGDVISTPPTEMKPIRNGKLKHRNTPSKNTSGKVEAKDVLAKHDIHWFGTPADSGLFVRQTYLADDKRWVSLERTHMFCAHNKEGNQPDLSLYHPGDTVLANIGLEYLQAFEVDETFKENKRRMVRLRRLLRRKEVDNTALDSPANELVYTDQLVETKLSAVVRRCLVRAFRYNEQLDRLDEKITAPYDRDGTGDAFFITHREVWDEHGGFHYMPLGDGDDLTLRQGFHPDHATKLPRLSGLDLFCGGGNFGRGLEDGDGIEMKWANDLNPTAIHTYMANSKPGCTPYLGSVDDLLHAALTGAKGAPRPGEVHFISGGSPCQGFSVLTNNTSTPRQRKNQSLIASFASFIDCYRPYYGLLENVASIVQPQSKKESCFFSQLVCAIVGLGYQVQILPLEAWSFGSSQSRIRLFLLFTAPGLRAPKPPLPSHSHPPGTKQRSFGKMSNGLPFGERYFGPTPFKFVSAHEAVYDLPGIFDGLADYCVGWPDHRTNGFTANLREQLKLIPTRPWGMNFRKLFYDEEGRRIREGRREMDRNLFDSKTGKSKQRTEPCSQGWGRVYPNHLFPTITTKCSLTDSKIGRINHWDETRPLSILEARRAQGFLDHEVVMGRPNTQWHIVGNSVDRHVALAFGLAIREAWLGTLWEDGREQQPPQQESSLVDHLRQRLSMEYDGLSTPDEIELVPCERRDQLLDPTTESSDEDKVFRDTPRGFYELTPATSIDGNEDVGAVSHERGQKRANPFLVEFMSKKFRESEDSR